MNTSTHATQDVIFGGYSEMYVAAPIELDYDEPNAVVEDQDVEFVEFVAVVDAIRTVELPVTCVIEENTTKPDAARQVERLVEREVSHVATVPAQRRTAA